MLKFKPVLCYTQHGLNEPRPLFPPVLSASLCWVDYDKLIRLNHRIVRLTGNADPLSLTYKVANKVVINSSRYGE